MAILDRKDPRLFVVVGPCSIHDPVAGLDYAAPPAAAGRRGAPTPSCWSCASTSRSRAPPPGGRASSTTRTWTTRSTSRRAWSAARRFLLDVNELGLPAAPRRSTRIAPQYYGDLVAWTAIGARTAESQTHREMASGPVHAGRLQERHRRRAGGGGQRHPLGVAARTASWASTTQGHVRHRPHPRQPLRPPGAARRRRAAPTTTRSPSRWPSRRWPRPSCRATSWWTARTPTRCKKPELQPLVMQRRGAPDPRGQPLASSASWWRASSRPATSPSRPICRSCSTAARSPTPASTGPPPRQMLRDAHAVLKTVLPGRDRG